MHKSVQNSEESDIAKKLPLRYREPFIVIFLLISSGLTFEIFSQGHMVSMPKFPFNVLVVFVYSLCLLVMHYKYKKRTWFRWFSGLPAVITSIGLCSVIFVASFFMPSDSGLTNGWYQLLGLSHLRNGYVFLMLEIYLLGVLGLVILKKVNFSKGSDIGFFLFHSGLWIFILTGIIGPGDIQSFKINLLNDGDEINIAKRNDGLITRLPFGLRLIDFKMKSYKPRLVLCEDTLLMPHDYNAMIYPQIDSNSTCFVSEFYVQVKRFNNQSVFKDSAFEISDDPGNYPAALVNVVNLKSRKVVSGWISSGSYRQKPHYIVLDNNKWLTLAKPEVKSFKAVVEVIHDNLSSNILYLRSNHPCQMQDWKLNLVGYDKSKGNNSNLSILEAVKDPWLPVVYAGGGLMVVGIGILFGYRRKYWIG